MNSIYKSISDGRTGAVRVADLLRQEILTGQRTPGKKLNLTHLRKELGVSVSLLREAVTRLVADGLLDSVEQKGYTVPAMSLVDLDEITRLRIELEPMALTSSMANGDLEWETEVNAALYRLNRIKRDAGDPESVEQWETAHNTFHNVLIRRCDMPTLNRFCAILSTRNERYRRIFLTRGEQQRDLAAEHTAIAAAACRGKVDEAATLLSAHIERTGMALRAKLIGVIPG